MTNAYAFIVFVCQTWVMQPLEVSLSNKRVGDMAIKPNSDSYFLVTNPPFFG